MSISSFFKHSALFCLLALFPTPSFARINSQLGSSVTQDEPSTSHREQRSASQEKEWTFLVYFAGVNNLGAYIPISLMQAQDVAGNDKFNIVAEADKYGSNEWLYRKYPLWSKEIGYPQLNIVDYPEKRPSKSEKSIVRLEAGRNKILCHQSLKKMRQNSSGTKAALYHFLEWGITNFPAKNYGVFVWDHGSGAVEPPPTVWDHDPVIEDPTAWPPAPRRGIAFHDTERMYLSGGALSEVLTTAQKNLLGGAKFNLLCLDACLMAMIESSTEFADNADYLIASQEVGWGSGWNYAESFRALLTQDLTPEELAKNIIVNYRKEMMGDFVPSAYKDDFEPLDYTLAAIDLAKASALAYATDRLANTLIERLKAGDTKLRDCIKSIRGDKNRSTWFYDNTYIDLHQFCQNLRTGMENSDELFVLCSKVENAIVSSITKSTRHPLRLPYARGISIYFPPRRRSSTYPMCKFARDYLWDDFLIAYRKSF